MLTGVTVVETKHGNPGEKRSLPAGIKVQIIPATNLPADSEIKFWAHPLKEHPWSESLAMWAINVGVGLRETDVKFRQSVITDVRHPYYEMGDKFGALQEAVDNDPTMRVDDKLNGILAGIRTYMDSLHTHLEENYIWD